MKKAAQTAKSIILAIFGLMVAFDLFVVIGEIDETIGLAQFFIIKATGLAAAYGLYKLGDIIGRNNLLPDWWNRLVAEIEKDQDL